MTRHRSRDTLQAWLDEFIRLGYRVPATLRVIEQDGIDGADTGLVVFRFDRVPLDVFVQPVGNGDVRWSATIEPHEHPSELTSVELADLAAELVGVSALVTFLEGKSAVGSSPIGRRGGSLASTPVKRQC